MKLILNRWHRISAPYLSWSKNLISVNNFKIFMVVVKIMIRDEMSWRLIKLIIELPFYPLDQFSAVEIFLRNLFIKSLLDQNLDDSKQQRSND